MNFETERKRMVDVDLRGRDIVDLRVLNAMLKVPRHEFVTEDYRNQAYADYPLPIGNNQTISQPYIVALMTQSAHLHPEDRVLEIGTGSGYQAAVLSELVKEVYTIEIVEALALDARSELERLGYENVKVKHGDGYQGWEEFAPFDAILLTAAAPKIPQPLIDQLNEGGRIILPLGGKLVQTLIRITKIKDELKREEITGVRFVPMTGEVRQ
ncbi:MAG: protein-L-isoaspartate(D-aspartate) O-methyltransferase [Nitrospinota bacterium]|nr:protein-L-isoaspartate(D-aspartate) O-methyltransferase [Nitrospinota bacterium]